MQFIETECFQLISSLVLLLVQDGSQSFRHHIHIPGRGKKKKARMDTRENEYICHSTIQRMFLVHIFRKLPEAC